MTAFRQLLQHPHYRLLGEHAAAELGQRQFHEVELTGVSQQGSQQASLQRQMRPRGPFSKTGLRPVFKNADKKPLV